MSKRFFGSMSRLITTVLLFSAAQSYAQVDSGLPDMPPMPKQQLPTPDEFAAGQIKAMDTNSDKRVTWLEFSARLRKAFDDMDTKRRGYLTHAELKAAYEKAIAQMPRPGSLD
jgi:hypothetical protein